MEEPRPAIEFVQSEFELEAREQPLAAAHVAVEAEQRSALALQALADSGRCAPEELGDLLGRQGGLLELAPSQHARDQRRACGAVGVDAEVGEHAAFVLGEAAAARATAARRALDAVETGPYPHP